MRRVVQHRHAPFPKRVSESRFVDLRPRVLIALVADRHPQMGRCTGIRFIDSTPLAVCPNARSKQHRVFAVDAARGKTSLGGFYGFQLHLGVNDRGDRVAVCLTRGNVDDRQPVPSLLTRVRGRFGKRFGDKGYRAQPLAEHLLVEPGVQLITRLRTNLRHRLMNLSEQLLRRKRALIATSYDQLNNIAQIEHTRHRSPLNFPLNFPLNLVCGLIAYSHLPKKPSLDLDPDRDLLALAAV